MKIIEKHARQMKKFKDVAIGEVFVEYDNENKFVQMKVTPVVEGKVVFNAVSMETGILYNMEDDADVEVVETTLTIE